MRQNILPLFTFVLPSSPLLNKARRVCSAWPSANRSQTAIHSWHCAEGEIGRRRREEQSEARRTENEDEQRMKTKRMKTKRTKTNIMKTKRMKTNRMKTNRTKTNRANEAKITIFQYHSN